eukprot:CAMPEP_0174351946 /NCGR_PEP_ID=MMETSP0811_2-20130205/9477_1 /TAXON_ID=73025 ORGANISM="Eutreptiella gymnastica-like, Strain CCMP1594" /NCGR_SAMPLE_ID=MMETSP0811_2 /ASSEMBLY_ACC=CAM_ASM_000667 /LENGTH=77 /DNA_ID=CAMNT_0015481681 /DNA_START=20 /DNA_END=250 /DNA_ORIENTATION=-
MSQLRKVRRVRNLHGRRKDKGVKRRKTNAASGSDSAPSNPDSEVDWQRRSQQVSSFTGNGTFMVLLQKTPSVNGPYA